MSAPVTSVEAVPQAAEPGAHVLELAGISKRWRRQPEPVLADISLTIGSGELVLIAGANGVGKTTLLRIAAGLLVPDTGGVRVLGLDPEDQRRDFQRQVDFLPAASAGLYARLTVVQHLQLWAKLALLSRAERAGVVERSLARFGLHDLATRRVDRMSMGQRQRVRLAGVFLQEPTLVLLDEPRNSLDETASALLIDAVHEVAARGGAVVWCAPTGEATGMAWHRRLTITGANLVEAA